MRWFSCLFLAAAFLALTAPSAMAATVVKFDLTRLVSNADVIVVADVVDTEAAQGESGRVYTTITFRTQETLKGQPGKTFSIRQVGGTAGDLSTFVPGMPHFEPKQQVFLFVSDFDTRPVITGLSQGRFEVVSDPDDETRLVVPRLQGVHLVEPGKPPTESDEPQAPDTAVPPTDDTDVPKVSLRIRDHNELFGQTHKFEAFRDQVRQLVEAQESPR